MQCIKNLGHVIVMKCDDSAFENGLSQSHQSNLTRPLLASINVAEFRRGSTSLFWTTHDTANENPSFQEKEILLGEY